MVKKKLPSQSVSAILVTDFDGTVTKYDFYYLVCREFPEISSHGFWQQYEQGKITHFEALRLIFSSIRSTEEQLLKVVGKMEIDPRFAEAVSLLTKKGWSVVIASGGCDWYIRQHLKDQGVSIPVFANPGEFVPGQGLQMHLPEKGPFFSNEIGVNKLEIVRDALKKTSRVAFAGDGPPDLSPALLVPGQRRFAKSWLAQKLREMNEEFQPFDTWWNVSETLINREF
jgi:2-hydroxy-3-keto-5-methylthiopentenyl-1-phosphate phosphatase